MKFKKLNTNWNADLHNPKPALTMIEESLHLNFILDASTYEHIDENDGGTIEFYEVYAYRTSEIPDEENFRERFRYVHNLLPSAGFYELKQSDWETTFPDDAVIEDDSLDKKELSHFLFLFNDRLVECIAGDYKFMYQNQASEKAKAKYPGNYFADFLAMFTSNFEAVENESFRAHLDLYMRLEGVDPFIGVLMELREIQKNNDLHLFLQVINEIEIEHFGMEQLKDFIWIIQHYGKEEL